MAPKYLENRSRNESCLQSYFAAKISKSLQGAFKGLFIGTFSCCEYPRSNYVNTNNCNEAVPAATSHKASQQTNFGGVRDQPGLPAAEANFWMYK